MGTDGRLHAARPLTDVALQHARLQGLIAAFGDGELDRDDTRAVQEHLRNCEGCRRELSLQRELSRALAEEPVPRASAALRRRIGWMGEPNPHSSDHAAPSLRRPAAAAAAVAIGICAVTALCVGRSAKTGMADIPVLRDALADCRRATARNFPRKPDLPAIAEGLRFPIRALYRPDIQLFSTWKTTLAGSPAAALAYRWRGIVVVQYTVPGELIRQQPAVGEALSRAGFYSASELGQGVVAVLEEGSGTLLIADAPPEELKRLIL